MVVSRLLRDLDVELANMTTDIKIRMYWVQEFIGLNLVFKEVSNSSR
jgi:hypothetical protein